MAVPLLAALGAAIGNSRRIELKPTWCEPPILWTAIVGDSGTHKSPALRLTVGPIQEMEASLIAEQAPQLEQYENALRRYEAQVNEWKKKAGRADAVTQEPPSRPQRPPALRYAVSDITVEALATVLQDNPRGVLLARDELSGWLASFGQYQRGSKQVDESHWLSMFNGEPLRVDRKTGDRRVIRVDSAAVSIIGSIQPGVLDGLIGNTHRESGLLARFLLTMPPRRTRRWTENTVSQRSQEDIKKLFERLYALAFKEGEHPQSIPLTAEAKRAWMTFYNSHAERQHTLTGDLAAAASKLEAYTARLALIVHCVRAAAGDGSSEAADKASVEAGVTLVDWFWEETQRIYVALREKEDERERRLLVELIDAQPGQAITVRGLMRERAQFKTAEDAQRALDNLADEGYGRWLAPAPGSKGGRPSVCFKLFPTDVENETPDTTDTDKTPAGDTVSGGFVNEAPTNGSVDPGATMTVRVGQDDPENADDGWGVL